MTLARTLVLAWILVPEDFGLLVISMIAVDFLLSVTNLGVIPALVQRRAPSQKQYDAAWTLGMIRAAVISVVVFLSAPFIANLFAEPRAVPLIQVLSIRPILEAAVSIKVAELIRNLQFRRMALIYLPEALANAVVCIILAPYFGAWALVAGALAGPLALTAVSYRLAPNRPRFVLDLGAVRPLIQFGRWIFLMSVVGVAGSAMVNFAIAKKLGSAALGVYYVATKVAFLPAEVSAEVVGVVTFPVFSRVQSNLEKAAQIFRAAFVGVAALLVPVCALLIALAPSFVESFLGPEWQEAAPVISLLALVNVVGLFGDMVAPVLKGLGGPSSLFLIELMQALLLIALIWGLADSFGVTGAALAWLFAVGATQTLCAIVLPHFLPRPFVGLARPLGVIAVISVAGGATAFALQNALPGLHGFALAATVGAAMMAGFLWLSDKSWGLGITRNAGLVLPRIAARFGAAGADR